ncbi:hypothetical protein Rsub_10253 [Raphidocelis subcapitata]|uniref:Heme O synthase n=1 Tax=Raphidocelis subcapitata TaxID=307507 RepID=A0A2V0PDG6_9CHLO|nr:hypothetical protein Rsub_10253 [Raphidocelis subcapitata]|eukprot:GBF97898.1 hypothetical protein Rsub_10253 [Raphidocelis subcapitata]
MGPSAACQGGACAAQPAAAPMWLRVATASGGRRAGAGAAPSAVGRAWPRGLSTQSAAAAAGGGTLGPAASAAAAAARPRSFGRRVRALLRDYKQLSKAKLSALVVLTAAAGYAGGSDGAIDWAGLAWTSLGTFAAAAAANALNQAYEVTNDALMSRTRARPLPAGRMGRVHAVAFAAVVGTAGVSLLAEKTNSLTAALGAANIVLYAGVYTPLKQLTWGNTWVGAVVGAIPPLMGWAAAAGSLEPASAVLAAALFFWQMPHFLALAWMHRDDYARGGFRMLSMYDATGRRTAAAALRHCAYLAPVGAAAVALGMASPWFAAEAAALAGVMGAGAAAFYRAPSQGSARKLFRGSLLYLPLLLLGFAVHREPNTHASAEEAAALLEAQWEAARARLAPLRAAAGGLLPTLPEARLRTVEERLGWIEEARWRIARSAGMQCPSRVFAEQSSEDQAGEAGGKDGSSSSGSAAGRGNSSGSSSSSSSSSGGA